MKRRAFLVLAGLAPFASQASAQQDVAPSTPTPLATLLDDAARLENLKAVIVARGGEVLAERGYRNNSPDTSTNIKSASKSVISLLVGIAIDRKVLAGVDEKIAPILGRDFPTERDPRLDRITVGNLLSMQSGLERTSGPNYGRWVASRNWVRFVLAQPFVDDPGGGMLYSTGSSHLLSAILTRKTGRSTLDLARDWLAPVKEFRIGGWDRDPQGIYLGGNQMAMSTRSLLAFGELYRNGGATKEGERIVSPEWIEASWVPRTNSVFSGDGYGYGWFLRRIGGEEVRYAWGFGGQMLYIVPSLGLTVAMTSDDGNPSAQSGYRDQLHGLLADVIAAVRNAPAKTNEG